MRPSVVCVSSSVVFGCAPGPVDRVADGSGERLQPDGGRGDRAGGLGGGHGDGRGLVAHGVLARLVGVGRVDLDLEVGVGVRDVDARGMALVDDGDPALRRLHQLVAVRAEVALHHLVGVRHRVGADREERPRVARGHAGRQVAHIRAVEAARQLVGSGGVRSDPVDRLRDVLGQRGQAVRGQRDRDVVFRCRRRWPGLEHEPRDERDEGDDREQRGRAEAPVVPALGGRVVLDAGAVPVVGRVVKPWGNWCQLFAHGGLFGIRRSDLSASSRGRLLFARDLSINGPCPGQRPPPPFPPAPLPGGRRAAGRSRSRPAPSSSSPPSTSCTCCGRATTASTTTPTSTGASATSSGTARTSRSGRTPTTGAATRCPSSRTC